ncbi:MAG: DEAD/DEAH box helicase [Betaproteobacteria bacterium RBG_16_56_24]|nr:MAG: DEAD/DEAH box helicase [Betaproteobacteria bacterium RBG_16_56_24]
MKIKFDSNQQYQRDAMDAVLGLFNGQPLSSGAFEFALSDVGSLAGLTELGFGNQFALDEAALLRNLQTVQQANKLPASDALDGMNFSVEMETGTGKTYVYLRSIFELHQRYGFSKFIIVVPSVAIREGVITSLRLMKEHFQALFGNVAFDSWVYDSKQYSKLRQFAQSSTLQILVMNIQAFVSQASNVIHQDKDQLSGRKPIEFVQAAQPIVVLDEPQNMESPQAKNAIASLNPLCTLRYSATHRNRYNLVYKLDPVQAYDLKLVKRIEVSSVLGDPDFNQPYIQVQSISATKTKVTAKLLIDVNEKAGPQRKSISISAGGVDLLDKSNQRGNYAGYIVDEIRRPSPQSSPGGGGGNRLFPSGGKADMFPAADGYVSFTNGLMLNVGQTHGGRGDDVMRVQIRETVREHFDKELRIKKLLPNIAGADARLKVLSLFFIDRVANYAAEDGKIRHWFIEAYKELAVLPKYRDLSPLPVDKVHNGYFAALKGIAKDTRGDTAADDDAYALIMQDKERLLSPDEPLRFIFSHSALREGWDNPNVFQICTLNETKSEIKKRQEIGRGLRLPVLESGERCFDASINRLTVIANEHYDEFAAKLQTEIEDECGVKFAGRIVNKKEARTVKLKQGWRLNADFKELWNRIKYKTRYAVEYKTPDLVDRAAKNLAARNKIAPSRISVQKSGIVMSSDGVDTQLLGIREAETRDYHSINVPDMLGYMQAKTELTRKTITEILIRSGRLNEVQNNPQQFLEQAQQAIEAELHNLMIDGIKYERINGQEYEMLLFEAQEITGALTSMIEVDNSIYDAVLFESEVERAFAEAMSTREDIKLFIKLPGWFKIETPIGTYNPDWAIVKQDDAKVYLVRETKSTKDQLKLRGSEWAKIQCGKAHFDTLKVGFAHVTSANDV